MLQYNFELILHIFRTLKDISNFSLKKLNSTYICERNWYTSIPIIIHQFLRFLLVKKKNGEFFGDWNFTLIIESYPIHVACGMTLLLYWYIFTGMFTIITFSVSTNSKRSFVWSQKRPKHGLMCRNDCHLLSPYLSRVFGSKLQISSH